MRRTMVLAPENKVRDLYTTFHAHTNTHIHTSHIFHTQTGTRLCDVQKDR